MPKLWRLLAAGATTAVMATSGGVASADPGGEDHGHDDIPVPTPSLPLTPPGSAGFTLIGQSDKDGATNSDMAFYGKLAYVGNYDGFRIIDISKPSNMRVLSDVKCRAVQSDLSIFKARGRMILLQAIDRPVDRPDCAAKDTGTTTEFEGPDGSSTPERTSPAQQQRNRASFGFEGLRMFDVTNPRSPKYLKFFRTECGAHTHTLVPDKKGKAVHAYVASYPLGLGITAAVDREAAGDLTCDAPHRKISIVTLPLKNPEAGTVRTKALSSDTEYYDPDGPPTTKDGKPAGNAPRMQGCHDHQAFLPRDIVVGSCTGDAQYWSVRDRGNPTSADGEAHTHIRRENGTTESFDFLHNAVVTWDGKVVAISDESGGGGGPRCDGEQSRRGFTFFYPLVEPGTPVDGFSELGRYLLDERPQNTEICVSHNGSVLPLRDGSYKMVQGFYQGGNSFYDFSNPANPDEIGFADLEDASGKADTWSTYWYNGTVFVNGGLNRRNAEEGPAEGNRGFEAYQIRDERGVIFTDRWRYSNPQTQEEFQVPKGTFTSRPNNGNAQGNGNANGNGNAQGNGNAKGNGNAQGNGNAKGNGKKKR